MYIVGFKEFLALPVGTVYAIESSGAFSEFKVKKSMDEDWEHQDLAPHNFDTDRYDGYLDSVKAMEEGEHLPMGFSLVYQNGATEEFYFGQAKDFMFAIYDKEDIQELINELTKCL